MKRLFLIAVVSAGACLTAPPAYAQSEVSNNMSEAAPPKAKPADDTFNRAGQIASQPARDVGVAKEHIPDVLIQAAENPYSTDGVHTCRQLVLAMKDLNEVLGSDYIAGQQSKENKAGKLAEAGGKTVVNALIPFRGLVREISGAAPAERRYNAALDAGLARRGFLRGLALAKRCR